MKTEADSNPSIPPTPTAPYTTAQWSTSSQIPIDPALQQQQPHATATPYAHYQGYSAHYPQAAYPSHYQPYAPPTTAQSAMPATGRQGNAQSSSGMDTADIATLNDALGSAGVDLRAEEESLQRSYEQHQSYRSFEDRSRKQPTKPSFDSRFLGPTMRGIATQHKVTKVPDDSVNYLALALRARLQDLITSMIAASHHRTDTQFERPASFYDDKTTPMWSLVVRSDVAKQLSAIEKVEREEELKIRRERKERADMAAAHAAALAAQAAGGPNAMSIDGYDDLDSSGMKKKRKKEGPGVTARNMSEDVRKKMSNAVASQAAGLGGKYAWMNSANAASPSTKAKPSTPAVAAIPAGTPPAAAVANGPTTTSVPAAVAAGSAASSWARPYVPTKLPSSTQVQTTEEDDRTVVIMRDAMFVIEKERGHGGGRGATRGWV